MPARPAAELPFERHAAAALGQALRERRKALGISVTAAAEAAHVSRVTWHRLEKGESTVALGSWLAAAHVLGLDLRLLAPGGEATERGTSPDAALPLRIRLADYPQLRHLAWQVGDDAQTLSPSEALGLYERNWRHLQPDLLEPAETALIQMLRRVYGEDRLRV
ncbi:helix-turn-helix transcriptional regulator [Luteimonas huabeiensis]|uniref:helix-turn-helix transcriptional regulator n=1 Tax=Luteimonas huabeiensis TaxID=1244513 RepID=UPI000464E275|nr:helix-turn-helix transcriptional regulator [Luteimonas huabeiensis]